MSPKADRLLFVALIVAVLFHGSALIYNIDKTYDAFVHIFFADHYARSWFEPWEYRWYTGFPVTSYPPLSHQLIALLSKIGGLKFGFMVVILLALCFFIIGIYRFSQLWVSKRSAGYAALFALVASSIVQTIHISIAIAHYDGNSWFNQCFTRGVWLFPKYSKAIFILRVGYLGRNGCLAPCYNYLWYGIFYCSNYRYGIAG